MEPRTDCVSLTDPLVDYVPLLEGESAQAHAGTAGNQAVELSSLFKVRHLGGRSEDVVSFEAKKEEAQTYFEAASADATNGTRRASGINNIGDVALIVLNVNQDETAPDAMKLPDDDKDARVARVEAFEQELQKGAFGSEAQQQRYADLKDVLMEDEQILFTLRCSEIEGLPCTTLSSPRVEGIINVSLVQQRTTTAATSSSSSSSSTGGGGGIGGGAMRLLFSVAEGKQDVAIREHFEEANDHHACVICCQRVCLCCHGRSSSMTMEYSALDVRLDQFFTLPLDSALIDTMCYISSKNEFHALAHKSDADCCCCCCCVMPSCPSCPVCCGIIKQLGYRAVSFNAHEEFKVGQQEQLTKEQQQDNNFNVLLDGKTQDANDVQWTINRFANQSGYVVIHYRNLLDKQTHHVKMRLVLGDRPEDAYQEAKRFVSTLTRLREFFTTEQQHHHQGMLRSVDAKYYDGGYWGWNRPARSAFRYYRPLRSGGYQLVVAETSVVGFAENAAWFDSIAAKAIRYFGIAANYCCSPRIAKPISEGFEQYCCNATTRPFLDFLGYYSAKFVNLLVYNSLHWAVKLAIAAILGALGVGILAFSSS